MRGIPIGSFVNRAKDRIVSRAVYAKILDACPNQEWRTIFALARIGGLRCPSELTRLRWSDIKWTRDRFVVQQPKTERYARHKERIVPLFPGLRVELERHFAAVQPASNDFVIQQFLGTGGYKLRCIFYDIADKAGLERIPRPFDNMRMSRCNEVRRRWGWALENLWMGHSAPIMEKHYLHVSDEEFTEAAREDTKPDDENIES
jgi:integrase